MTKNAVFCRLAQQELNVSYEITGLKLENYYFFTFLLFLDLKLENYSVFTFLLFLDLKLENYSIFRRRSAILQ